ncbi:MAG: excisionase family DNA-binding protein [Planctomycetota bacterium]|nr:excisionase family DNA-binding protein [Planctomycetota bacterium]
MAKLSEPLRLESKSADLAGVAGNRLADLLENQAMGESVIRLTAEGVSEAVPMNVPVEVLKLLAGILKQLAEGNTISIVPYNQELTTQQAADILNVSRPYLVKSILDQGDMPFRHVGNRRRIRFQDLMEYRKRDSEKRQKILDEMTAETEELGLYDE